MRARRACMHRMLLHRNARNFARTRISATEKLKCRHFRSGFSRVDDDFEWRRCYQRWSRSRAAAEYVRARRTCMHRMLLHRNAKNFARTRMSATKQLKCRHFRSGFSRVDVDFETRRCYQRWSRSSAENDKGVNILKTTFVGYTIAAAWIRARALWWMQNEEIGRCASVATRLRWRARAYSQNTFFGMSELSPNFDAPVSASHARARRFRSRKTFHYTILTNMCVFHA